MMLASTYSRRADERQKSDDGEDRRDETEDDREEDLCVTLPSIFAACRLRSAPY
jgi:hypothetical protein